MIIFEKIKMLIENKKASYNEIMHGIIFLHKLELITDKERNELSAFLWDKIKNK